MNENSSLEADGAGAEARGLIELLTERRAAVLFHGAVGRELVDAEETNLEDLRVRLRR